MPEIALAVEAAVQRQDDLGLNPAALFRPVAASGSCPTCSDGVIHPSGRLLSVPPQSTPISTDVFSNSRSKMQFILERHTNYYIKCSIY